MTKDGTPSKQAYDRLNAAIFQQAYQNDKLTEMAFQSPDEEVKNIVRALNMAAPNAIDLEGLEDYDVRPFVNEAVEMAINAKRNSVSLSNLVKQSDMTTHPLSKDILEMFANNPRSARAMGENLNTLFDNAYKEATQSADMFGDVQKKPVYQVIKDSFAKKPEEDLFTAKDEKSEKKSAPPRLTPPPGLELKKGRNEQVVLAARALAAKKITKEEFDAYVDYHMPINTILGDKLEAPIEDNLMKDILLNKIKQKKKPELINASIADGTKVGLRMDIPALDWGRENGVNGSVVSIHKGSSPENKTQGENIGYKSAGAIKNVVFATRSQETAFKIAQQLEPEIKKNQKTGKEYIKDVASKSPQQTIEGSWVNMSPSEIMRQVKENLNNPAWKQISLDPLRHSYFYDRDSRQPVISADEVLQVGRFVLAKNVKFASKEDFLYEKTEQKSKISKEEQQLESELKGKTLLDVSKWNVDNAPNKFAKIIANMVDKRLNAMSRRGIKFDFEIQSGNQRLASLYGARGLTKIKIGKTGEETSFKITLNGAAVLDNQDGYPSGMNYKTIAHELLHVATRGQLALRNSKDPLVIELNNLRNQI
jgi:hypothetical protein